MNKLLTVKYLSKFKKDYKTIVKRRYNEDKFKEVIKLLRSCQQLPAKYKDHALTGDYSKYRECRIESDWLLVYRIENDTLTLILFIINDFFIKMFKK